MNLKRYTFASLAAFLIFQILDFIIHGVILSKTYKELVSIWRPNMESIMWIMTITSLFMSFLLVYVFVKGYENRGILEGLRFGVISGLLVYAVNSINQYVIYPVPCSLLLKWLAFGMFEFIVVGVVISLIYKNE